VHHGRGNEVVVVSLPQALDGSINPSTGYLAEMVEGGFAIARPIAVED
jgi:hypothetical protein